MLFPLVRPSVLVLVLALSSSFAQDAAAFRSVDFQPLKPGDSWTYLEDFVSTGIETVLLGTELVNGVPTRPIESMGEPNTIGRTFYTNDARGLRVHQDLVPDPDGFVFVFTTPITELPATFEIGTVFPSAGDLVFTLSGFGTAPGDYSYTVEVIGVEPVAVPAGSFNALRIDWTLRITVVGPAGTATLNSSGIDWWARNLGVVRSIETADGDTSIFELVSTNLQLCGDVADDGFVGPEDVTLFRNVLAGLASFTTLGEAKCTVTDQPSDCDLLDLTVIRREIEGPLFAPGISQLCEAATGPGIRIQSVPAGALDEVVVVGEGVESLGFGAISAIDLSELGIQIFFGLDLTLDAAPNGVSFTDMGNSLDDIIDVIVTPPTSVAGFDASRVSFTMDTIEVDLGGLSVRTGNVIALAVITTP